MPARDFFTDAARKSAAESVKAVELETGAEVVVVVKRLSGDYRAADRLGGFIAALLVLSVLIFHPQPFDERLFPVEVVLSYALGVLISANLEVVRRALSGRAMRAGNTRAFARASFFDRGVSRTKQRVGILVYVSIFERALEIVPDVGVDLEKLGAKWSELETKMRAAVGALDLEVFLASLRATGPVLGELCPRGEDDENELPDEVMAE